MTISSPELKNIYLGGGFTSVDGSTRNHLASVEETTGILNPFNPNCNDNVNCFAMRGNNLYIGGRFTMVSGSIRTCLAAVHKDTGALQPLNVSIIGSSYKSIVDMKFFGSVLYFVGDFSEVEGKIRNGAAAINVDAVFGEEILLGSLTEKKSIWPLDFFIDYNNTLDREFFYGEYLTGNIRTDETSTIHSHYKPFKWSYNDLFLTDDPVIEDVFYAPLTSSIWTVPEETNSVPFFDSENDFSLNTRVKYKDYTNIPEYIVSNFINDGTNQNYDMYESGSLLENEEVFIINGAESKNLFNIKKDFDKQINSVEFRFNYANLFRPYKNLYPVEKILQISKLLLNSLGDSEINGTVETTIEFPEIFEKQYIKNFLIEPFVSPGILLNTIKTGVPASWPYLTSSHEGLECLTYSSQKFPFESIYNPLKYLNSVNLCSYKNADDLSYVVNASYSGSAADQKYIDCIYNFIKDSSDFFLDTNKNYTYFSSKPESSFTTFLSGNTYGMIISLDNYFLSSNTLGSQNKFTSISPSPYLLGPLVNDGEYFGSLNIPPYLKFYEGEYKSSPTYNKLKILFTPEVTGKYTLSDILSQSVIQRQITDTVWNSFIAEPLFRANGQDILTSYNFFEFEKFGEFDKKWNISGKWEVPVFDFRDSISKISTDASEFSQVFGYGHQYGKKSGKSANLSLNIKDVEGFYSLADAVGFDNRTYKLGKVKQFTEVSELICVVPFNNNTKELISISEQSLNYQQNINLFDYFMFPIKYDFKYGSAQPFRMYCFETKMNLYYEDLSRIWQNVMPAQSYKFEEGTLVVTDNIVNNPTLNDLFEDDISWMIFKIKQRSLTNDFNDKHTFNWPYDNFSITELGKLDINLSYNQLDGTNSFVETISNQRPAKQREKREVDIINKQEYRTSLKRPKEPNKTSSEPPVTTEGYGEVFIPPPLPQKKVSEDTGFKFVGNWVDEPAENSSNPLLNRATVLDIIKIPDTKMGTEEINRDSNINIPTVPMNQSLSDLIRKNKSKP